MHQLDQPQSPLPSIRFDGQSTPVKILLFIIICLAWILPGLWGHAPWKFDEAVNQGIVFDLTHGGHWLAPTLAGQRYLVYPPFFFWVSASLAHIFGGWIPLHDAARLASGLFMIITFTGVGLLARELYGPRASRMAVITLMGCAGLIVPAHEMSPILSWLSGLTWSYYGLILAARRPVWAGTAWGLGFSLAFLSNGLLAIALLIPLLILVPILIPAYRAARWLPYLLSCLFWVIPGPALWLFELHHHDLITFNLWWQLLVPTLLSPTHWIDSNSNPLYYFITITWYAWPAYPVAIVALWQQRRQFRQKPANQFGVFVFVLTAVILGFSTSPSEKNCLPLLVPISILVAGGIDHLRRGLASALDWFGVLTFGLITILLWLGWIAQITGHPKNLVDYLEEQLPGYHFTFEWWTFTVSLILTALWGLLLLNSRKTVRRSMVNWTSGMTITWILLMTLWLPYIDSARSYQFVMKNLGNKIHQHPGCVYSTALGDAQRGLMMYYLNIRTTPIQFTDSTQNCHWWLAQGTYPTAPRAIPAPWVLYWSGSRPGDHQERFYLFRR
jgi:4-amino-4-deoxy-L-arabinose transferase-like glycosyltransferase